MLSNCFVIVMSLCGVCLPQQPHMNSLSWCIAMYSSYVDLLAIYIAMCIAMFTVKQLLIAFNVL